MDPAPRRGRAVPRSRGGGGGQRRRKPAASSSSSSSSSAEPSRAATAPPQKLPHVVSGEVAPDSVEVDGKALPAARGMWIHHRDMSLQWEPWMELLSPTNKTFQVVGCVGTQGAGKSTLLSALGRLQPSLEFPRQGEAHVLGFRKCTNGVHLCVTAEKEGQPRRMLVDCWPVNSVASVASLLKSKAEMPHPCHSLENMVELQSLQVTTFLLHVCDVLLVALDQPWDDSMLRLLLRADLLCQKNAQDRAHIVFVYTHAEEEEEEKEDGEWELEEAFQEAREVLRCSGSGTRPEVSQWCRVPRLHQDRSTDGEFTRALQRLSQQVSDLAQDRAQRRPASGSALSPPCTEQDWMVACHRHWSELERSSSLLLFNKVLQDT